MAQIIPSITSLPIDSSAAPSVEDIQDRLPSICVDYLSHDWSEEDVWASWRSMTRHKYEIANGVRLENASWRTWQKQRNKLKTISPETLNWLKDSDVTWLYGPLHTAQVEPVRPMKVSSTDDKYGLDPGYKKPILKHRTLSEMLTIHQPSSPILEATKQEEDDESSNSGRPPLVQTKSDTNIVRVRTGGLRHFAPDNEAPPIGQGDADGKHSPVPEVPSSGKKHISFNTFVEQVIAVDEPLEALSDSSDEEEDMLSMRSRSRSSSSRSSRPSLSRNSSSGSGSNGEHLTIAKIAPTMLKTNGVYHSSLPAMVYAPTLEYRTPEAEKPTFDFPSPQAQTNKQPWSGDDDDDDEFSSVGYDYYSGQSGAAPSHVVRTGSVPQPVKAQTPPKTDTLRPPGQSAEPDLASSPLSSSASSSGNNLSSSPNVPGRSILKVRPPAQAAPKEDNPPSPPLSTYFNYNPSAATGIGGMRSAGAYDYPGASGSPTSPNVPTTAAATGSEERGRSTSRDRSSLYGRSPSGSSSISTSSMSPGAPRSPNELPSASKQKPAQAPSLGAVAEQSGSPMEVDHEEYVPARSETPTPHSSPQIAFRPLKDTSPASLPHHPQLQTQTHPQSQSQTQAPTAPLKSFNSNSPKSSSPDLPKADSPRLVSPVANRTASRATTAHVGTNAAPTIANNSEPTSNALHRTQSNTSLPPNSSGHTFGHIRRHRSGGSNHNGDDSDDDGSSIMGRAANIANTAKDLLGALWYGAHSDQKGANQGPRRHASQG